MYSGFGQLVTAAVTPFSSDGSVNHDEFARLVRHLIDTGSDSVVVAGTTGESPTLSDDEKLALFATARNAASGEAKIIAGTGCNSTQSTIELSRRAVEQGVDGLLIVTPYYNKPPTAGLMAHFAAVAQGVPETPIMLYNVPSRTVINLPAQVVIELAKIANIVALKQANPDLEELISIRQGAPNLAVYAGDDASLMPMLPLGAVGVVSVAGHIVGRQMKSVIEAFNTGDIDGARRVADPLEDVYQALAVAPNPIPIRSAVAALGFEVGDPRLPLVPATNDEREVVQKMMQQHELITPQTHV